MPKLIPKHIGEIQSNAYTRIIYNSNLLMSSLRGVLTPFHTEILCSYYYYNISNYNYERVYYLVRNKNVHGQNEKSVRKGCGNDRCRGLLGRKKLTDGERRECSDDDDDDDNIIEAHTRTKEQPHSNNTHTHTQTHAIEETKPVWLSAT